jgi:hypothetical protein
MANYKRDICLLNVVFCTAEIINVRRPEARETKSVFSY